MKIASVNVYYVRGEGLKPVLVKIQTDEGISGLGEAAISYGSGGTAVAGMIKDLSERFCWGLTRCPLIRSFRICTTGRSG